MRHCSLEGSTQEKPKSWEEASRGQVKEPSSALAEQCSGRSYIKRSRPHFCSLSACACMLHAGHALEMLVQSSSCPSNGSGRFLLSRSTRQPAGRGNAGHPCIFSAMPEGTRHAWRQFCLGQPLQTPKMQFALRHCLQDHSRGHATRCVVLRHGATSPAAREMDSKTGQSDHGTINPEYCSRLQPALYGSTRSVMLHCARCIFICQSSEGQRPRDLLGQFRSRVGSQEGSVT